MKQITVLDVENSKSYTFNDLRSEGSFISKVEGFEYPSVMEAIEDVPNAGGAYYINSKFGSRRCSLTALITCDRLNERVDLLAALRQTGHLKLITFTTLDDRALQFYAMIKNLVFPYTKMETPLLLDLIAPDYRFYNQTETVVDSNAGAQNITNNGNEITSPVLRINGAGSVFTLANLSTGQTFTLTHTLTGADYVDIDMAEHTVMLNGATSIFSDFVGDFFDLIPGLNIYDWDVTGGDGSTSLKTTFRDAFNGV